MFMVMMLINFDKIVYISLLFRWVKRVIYISKIIVIYEGFLKRFILIMKYLKLMEECNWMLIYEFNCIFIKVYI